MAVTAAPVQAGCWQTEEVSAATVRELQSMLMVAALRCQVAGFPMMDHYNAFVQHNRTTIGAMNDRLKIHFIHALGPVEGQRAYDAFTTAMANGYGAKASGADVCAEADSLAREAAMLEGSSEGLVLLAQREGLSTRLPDGACGPAVEIATAAPASTIATPPPAAAPVVLASVEVVSGLPPR